MPAKGSKTTTKSKTRKTKKQPKMNLSKMVKKIIYKEAETKVTGIEQIPTLFNSNISVSGDKVSVLPTLTLGTGSANRMGDRVIPIKLVIRGYVAYASDIATYQPAQMLGIRLFIYSDKTSSADVNNIFNYNLIDNGGTSENYTGTAMDWLMPHNSDQFRFYADKRFKMLKPYGLTNGAGGITVSDISSMHSSMMHPFTVTIKGSQLPKNLIYDPVDASNTPVNFNPMISVGWSDLLSTTSPIASTTFIKLCWRATLYYKDF